MKYFQDFTVTEGQNATLQFPVTDSDAAPQLDGSQPPLDITTGVLEWRVYAERGAAPVHTKAGTISDGPNGIAQVDIQPADLSATGSPWLHQLWLTMGGRTWPVSEGTLTVLG